MKLKIPLKNRAKRKIPILKLLQFKRAPLILVMKVKVRMIELKSYKIKKLEYQSSLTKNCISLV